jgi:hypothetical protein
MLMTLAFRGYTLRSSWQNGTGIIRVIEPYLALTVSGPPAIPAGVIQIGTPTAGEPDPVAAGRTAELKAARFEVETVLAACAGD